LYLPHDAGKISLTDRDAKADTKTDASGETEEGEPDDFEDANDEAAGSEKIEIRVPQLLAGDTLFKGSIGRTDLWGGSMEEIMDSIRSKLMQLPDATIVHPGHGPMTTIGQEREVNPFLRPE
jgi:hypothetical protein